VLLAALALRLINLNERPLWYDEAFAVLFAEKGLDAMLYGTLTPVAGGAADIHPLLYYTTLHGWMGVIGQSAFAVRLWSVFLGVLTVSAMFTLARKLINVRVAWAATIIVALAAFHVQYSQETRMYALLGLLTLLTTYTFLKALTARHPSSFWRYWIIFGVLAGLMMYTQQLAAFYLIALAGLPIVKRRWQLIPGLIVGIGLALLIYSPWLLQLPGQLAKVGSYYWIEKPNIAAFLRTTFSFLVVNLDIPRQTFVWTLSVAVFLVILLGAFLLLRLTTRHKRKLATSSGGLTALWLAVIPVVLMWLVSQVRPVYLERALLPSALLLYLFVGWMLAGEVIPRFLSRILVIPLFILFSVGLYFQYTWSTFPNSPFHTVTQQIEAQWQTGDIIIHQNKLSALPMIFYGRELTQTYIGDPPGSPQDTLALPTQETLGWLASDCVQEAAQGATRIWWIEFERVAAQSEAAGRPEYRQSLEWLNTYFTPVEALRFNDLMLMLYANPLPERPSVC
jgi:4-amino-4-deoxy-L-arabinose transferase-like glycosyltransferase